MGGSSHGWPGPADHPEVGRQVGRKQVKKSAKAAKRRTVNGKPTARSDKKNAVMSDKALAALCLRRWRTRLEERFLPPTIDCLGQLSDDEVWWRPNEASNSVGNIVLHLCGNMRQWIVSGLGGAKDIRERDKEFSERGPIARGALSEQFRETGKECCAVLERLKPEDLMRRYRIQGFDVTGYEAAEQVSEHIAYHLGQIIYLTKLKRAKDLGFTRLPAPSSKPTERKL
jgi:uncharacterized damage-inducible protein DinB